MRFSPLLLLSLAACSVEVGSGQANTETRSFDRVDAISVSNFLDVEVHLADIRTVEVTCDDNLLSFIETEVEDGRLRIKSKDRVQLEPKTRCTAMVKIESLHDLQVSGSGSVIVPEEAVSSLETVDVSGSGGVRIEEATGCDVELRVSGSGSIAFGSLDACTVDARVSGRGGIEITGSVDQMVGRISGSGEIDGREFLARTLDARVSGSGAFFGFATQSAHVEISGSGFVHLYGGPEVDSDISGSGEVVLH